MLSRRNLSFYYNLNISLDRNSAKYLVIIINKVMNLLQIVSVVFLLTLIASSTFNNKFGKGALNTEGETNPYKVLNI